MNILLVEDESLLLHHLKCELENVGYRVIGCKKGEDALYLFDNFNLDIAIIDLGLPGIGGLELIKTVRSKDIKTPILVLTARSNWRDKVKSLNIGADDYLVKPFELEELKARINALVRRSAGFSKPLLTVGSFNLDTVSKKFKVNSDTVSLTKYEFMIMEFFMLNNHKLLSRAVLEDLVYGTNSGPESNVIEVLVNRLRKKLLKHSGINPIKTIRGEGYRLEWEIS